MEYIVHDAVFDLRKQQWRIKMRIKHVTLREADMYIRRMAPSELGMEVNDNFRYQLNKERGGLWAVAGNKALVIMGQSMEEAKDMFPYL